MNSALVLLVALAVALLFVDMGQTVSIAMQAKRREVGFAAFFIGERPTVLNAVVYFAVWMAIVIGVAVAAYGQPAGSPARWLAMAGAFVLILIELDVTLKNHDHGVGLFEGDSLDIDPKD